MPNPNATFEEDDLSALLDGELSPSARAALEARLGTEPQLQAELDAITDARSFMAEHGPVAAPPDLLAGVLAAVDAEAAAGGDVVAFPWYKRPLGVPAAGWAVAAAAVLVVYVAMPSFQGSGPATAEKRTAARAPMARDLGKSVPDPLAYGGASDPTPKQVAGLEGGADEAGGASDDAVAMVERPAEDVADQARAAPLGKQALEIGTGKALSKLPQKGYKAQKGYKVPADEKVDLPGLANTEPLEQALEDVFPDAGGGAAAPSDESAAFARVPYQYTVYTDDPQALMQLEAIAGRYQGELKNRSGLELEEQLGAEAATVVVKIPAHALQDFGRSIQGLGNVYQSSDNRVFAGDPVEVRVKVQLAAGKTGSPDVPKNAARSKADRALEVDQLD